MTRPAEEQPAGAGQYKWWVVFMLWFVCFFNYADRQAIFAIFPVLEKEFGFNKAQLGLIGSAFMWVYAGFAPVAGFAGDKLRRKTLILVGFIFWSIVTLMTGWCKKLSHFVAVRAAEGFGEAFYFPASMSLISDYHSPRTRSRAMAFHQSSVYIGTIAGSAVGGYIAHHYGWRSAFYFFGGAGLIVAAILFATLREPLRTRGIEGVIEERLPLGIVLPAIFRSPAAILIMLAFIGANFVAMTFLTWMPSFLGQKFGMNLVAAGIGATIYIQLSSAVGAPIGGALADFLARKHPGGRLITQALGLICGAAFIFFTGTTREVTTLVIAMTIFGFCKGLYDSNIFASLYDFVEPRVRASAAGVMNAVGWTGGALAPVTIGVILNWGGAEQEVANMSKAIAFGGAIYILAAALLLTATFVFARRDVVKVAP